MVSLFCFLNDKTEFVIYPLYFSVLSTELKNK